MNLVFVGAGLSTPKKGNARVLRRHRYLNYGLLSLANGLATNARCVFHGHFDDPRTTMADIKTIFPPSSPTTFLVSCPSFLALEWSRTFVTLVRQEYGDCKVLFGGRWVVDGNVQHLAKLIPGVDAFVEGIAEATIGQHIRALSGVSYELAPNAHSTFLQHGLSFLDYRKLFRPEEFVPSFEVSRGCGAGCVFCAEANVHLTAMKPPPLLCSEIATYRADVPNPIDRYYLEASLFVPRMDWIEAFIRERQQRGLQDIEWRTEARVDMFTPQALDLLAKAGLRVLDIGFESASPIQLKRMKKARDPQEYIERCEKLLRRASDAGILTKVNILLFPGETRLTLDETAQWLTRNAEHISGVSIYPAVYYGFHRDDDPLWRYYCSLGASFAKHGGSLGISMMNLSPEISAYEAEALAKEISAVHMGANSYYRLKSFSYFDPRYSFADFVADIEGEGEGLSFGALQ